MTRPFPWFRPWRGIGWETWAPQFSAKSVAITARATYRDQNGCVELSTGLAPDAPAPIVNDGGVVSAASYATAPGISPGEMISVFGSNLAQTTSSAASLPLSTHLENTTVLIAGSDGPLLFASYGQVKAVLPVSLNASGDYFVVTTRGTTISVPKPVTIASANPAIFTIDASGKGQAHAYHTSGGSLSVVDAAHPAVGGETLLVYATGLGATDFTPQPGAAAPLDRLVNTLNPVIAKIGGANAKVAFAGLAPGFAGLYQLNLVVPSGLPGGAQILTLNVAGAESQPVTIAIQ